jgi:hypothetical protein
LTLVTAAVATAASGYPTPDGALGTARRR